MTESVNHSVSRDEANRPMQSVNNLRPYDHQARGELEIPDSAPLIFPDLSQEEESAVKESMWKQKKGLAADYMDRRAQAIYVSPSTVLQPRSQPQPLDC